MRKKLILDLDTGIDDALAIAYALGSADEIDLIGITATYGNVAVPLAARNALAVLHLFGRDDVPVYPGVDHPIAPATLPENAWHHTRRAGPGLRALAERRRGRLANGRFVVTNSRLGGGPPFQRHRRRNHPRLPARSGSTRLGGRFLITAAREYGPDLTHQCPTGAMTTMATVFRNAPDLKDSGVNVTLMGGALTLPGNVSPGRRSEHLPRPRGSRLSVQVWRTHHHDRPRRDPPDRAHSGEESP